MVRVGRLNKIFNRRDGPSGPSGPSGPTQQDFRHPRWWGYETAEVDAFREAVRDTFLGVRQPPLTLDEAHDKRFRMARRRGYDVVQVDAFCDDAEERLAEMESHARADHQRALKPLR